MRIKLRRPVCHIVYLSVAVMATLLGSLHLVRADELAQQASIAQCAFMDAGLAEACNPGEVGRSLLPTHQAEIISGYIDAKENNESPDKTYLHLAKFIPDFEMRSKEILNNIAEPRPPLETIEIALLKPRVVSDCLDPAHPICLISPQYARGIGDAMRKMVATVRHNEDCNTQSGNTCLMLLSSAVETEIEFEQWLPLIATLFEQHASVCKAPAHEMKNCINALVTDLTNLTATWAFGEALAQSKDLSCLSDGGRSQIEAFQRAWRPIAEDISYQIKLNPTLPSFLSIPSIATKLLALQSQRTSVARSLVNAPSVCFQQALRLNKIRNDVSSSASRTLKQTKMPIETISSKCENKRDVRSGVFDICFDPLVGPLAGLRMIFTTPPHDRAGDTCLGIGDLQLLFPKKNNEVFAVEAGVGRIGLPHLCDKINQFSLQTKPTLAFTSDAAQMQSAIAALFPTQINLQNLSVEVEPSDEEHAFPQMRISFVPSLAVSDIALSGVRTTISVGPNSSKKDNDSESYLSTALHSLESAMVGKSTELSGIEVNGLKFKTSNECKNDGSFKSFSVTGQTKAPLGGVWPDDVIPIAINFCAFQNQPTVSLESPLSDELLRKLTKQIVELVNVPRYAIALTEASIVANSLQLHLVVSDSSGFRLEQDIGLPLNAKDSEARIRGAIQKLVGNLAAAAVDAEARKFVTDTTAALNGALGGAVRIVGVSLSPSPATIRVQVNIPGIDPILTEIKQGEVDTKLATDALKISLVERVNAQILKALGNEISICGFKITDVHLAKQDANSLAIAGKIMYTGDPSISAPISIQLLPSLGSPQIGVPDPKDLIGQLNILSKINSLLSFEDGAIKPDIVFEGTTPLLYITTKANVALFGDSGISGEVKLYARPGDNQLHFANKLLLKCTGTQCWFPVASGLDVGNPQGLIDLEHPDHISIGASLAITPGAETVQLVNFEGGVALDPESIKLTGALSIAGASVAETKGEWFLRLGVLTFQNGPTGAANLLPLPSLGLTLDPPHCLFSGGMSAKLFGLARLDIGAGLLFGDGLCNGQPSPPSDEYARKALSSCSSVDNAKITACGNGEAEALGIARANLHFVAPLLPPRLPNVDAHFQFLSLAKIDANLSPALAKLNADLGILDVVIMLPTLDSVTADQLRDILEALLKPSLSLDALLKRKIVISTFPPAKNEAEPSNPSAPTANSPAPAGTPQSPVEPPPPQVDNSSASGGQDESASNRSSTKPAKGSAVPGVWSNVDPFGLSCTADPAAPLTWPSGSTLGFMRRNDACSLVGPSPTNRVLSIGYDEIADAGKYLLSCGFQNCDLTKVVGLGISEGTSQTLPPPENLNEINFISIAPTVFAGHPAKAFEAMNSLIDTVFARQAAKLPPLALDCVREQTIHGAKCGLASAIDTQKKPASAVLYPAFDNPVTVQPGSFTERLFEMYCSDSHCSSQGKAAISKMFSQPILGIWSDGNDIHTLMRAPQASGHGVEPEHLILISFAKDGSVKNGPIFEVSGPHWMSSAETQSPGDNINWSEFVRLMHVEDSNSSWVVVANSKGMISAAPRDQKAGARVVVVVRREDNTTWTCVKQYEDLDRKMQEWSTEADGFRLDPLRYRQIKQSENQSILISHLITDDAGQNGFSTNPLLMFGDPGAGAQCR